MMYSVLRVIAGIALRWFYRSIDVEGAERIPKDRPCLLVCNHPNALVDALLVGWVAPRRIVLTAKATLFRQPALGWLLRQLGIVPLVRARDVRAEQAVNGSAPPAGKGRNDAAFRALRDALGRGAAVLIFPEGISHDDPALAPIRTGAARIALDTRAWAEVDGFSIIPIGLTFERKDVPRTRVLVRVGEPLAIDGWEPPPGIEAVPALTAEIDARLRSVTLNFASVDAAGRAAALSALFAGLESGVRDLGSPRPLRDDVAIAKRIEAVARDLRIDDAAHSAAVEALLDRADSLSAALAARRIALDDVAIESSGRSGVWFTVRELLIFVTAGIPAFWGWLNHWIPFRAARAVARRSVESAADPAMRTIVAGLLFVLAGYVVQTAVVDWMAGRLVALLYLLSLPLAADINFLLRERLAAARRRARTYFLFRREPSLREQLGRELESLREDAQRIEALVSGARDGFARAAPPVDAPRRDRSLGPAS